ncbi:translocation protein 1 [Brevipalpus obovatus]|uniref:translocation protein 1 n=1 Tax=Brevipalpus obovatus TaxID=246614 RepID=UPI003D9E8E10
MADRRRGGGRKRKELEDQNDENKTQKLEFEIAKYLRSKLPPKRTTLLAHKVDYFIASKAIDCLLDSKWAIKGKNNEDPLFTTRESVVAFMQKMLTHQLFHRAKAIIVSKKDKKRLDDEGSGADDGKKKEKAKKDKIKSDSEKNKEKIGDKKDEKEKEKEKDKEKKKEKKKIKLDMHMDQVFVDGNEPYVWLYDPVSVRTWFFGALVVMAGVALCLFPLWPKTFRSCVFYLSIAVATFLFTILVLVVLRLVIFVIVWLLSLGKHSFWILPNLTEDVGFFESFWPLYQYEYKGGKDEDKVEKKDTGDEDNEDGDDNADSSRARSETGSHPDGNDGPEESGSIHKEVRKRSNSERSSSSERGDASASTRSSENGFEILDTTSADCT